MALIQVNYMSKALFRIVPLNVILPVDRFDADTDRYLTDKDRKYKTLYLLHGLLGNYTDWVSQTRIQKWAEEKNLAVVMPSGDNAFYFKSRTPWNDYETFIGEEGAVAFEKCGDPALSVKIRHKGRIFLINRGFFPYTLWISVFKQSYFVDKAASFVLRFDQLKIKPFSNPSGTGRSCLPGS